MQTNLQYENFKYETVAGDDNGINISAIFISLESGETLMKYAGDTNIDIIVTPEYRISAWSATTIFFISLLAVCSLAGLCCFVRRRQHEPLELPRFYRSSGGDTAQQDGMSSHLVKAMPCVVYEPAMDRNGTNATCVICLEDYVTGDKLRLLPCKHSKSLCSLSLMKYCFLSWLSFFSFLFVAFFTLLSTYYLCKPHIQKSTKFFGGISNVGLSSD
jgi:hypothetical protein